MLFFVNLLALKSILSDISIASLLSFGYSLDGMSFLSFYFRSLCLWSSSVSLVDSIWLDHVLLSILLISVLGGFNPFTFKVISHKEGLLLFYCLFSVCFRGFFLSLISRLLSSFVLCWFFVVKCLLSLLVSF